MKITCPNCSRRIRIKKSRDIHCQCGKFFSYTEFFGKKRIYLLDYAKRLCDEERQDLMREEREMMMKQLRIKWLQNVNTSGHGINWLVESHRRKG